MSLLVVLGAAAVPFSAGAGTALNVSDRDGNHAGLAGVERATAVTLDVAPGTGGEPGRGSSLRRVVSRAERP